MSGGDGAATKAEKCQSVTGDKVRVNTGWKISFRSHVDETPAPTESELETPRDLHGRTARIPDPGSLIADLDCHKHG